MRSFIRWQQLAILVLLATALPAQAKDKEKPVVYPVAILPFQERGRDVRELGDKVTDLVFANLITHTELFLVDREDLEKVIQEQELNLSGAVKPDQAVQIGQLTGAKIIVTGSVLQIDKSLYLIAKIIGTETSRVVGASVKGNVKDDLGELVKELAGDVAKTISKRADHLVAKPRSRQNRIAALKKKLGNAKRPILLVSITERHVGQATIDPAAETELTLLATETGFEAIDPKEGSKEDADVLIIGEGFSEFAVRHGNLISVKARLEVKAIDRKSGKVLAIDRQTSVAVDLTEQFAGKSALEEAAARIAERLLPKLVTPKPVPPKSVRPRKGRR
jgi:TolB-like protein